MYPVYRLTSHLDYQTYRIVRVSSSVVRQSYPIMGESYPIIYLVNNKGMGSVIISRQLQCNDNFNFFSCWETS